MTDGDGMRTVAQDERSRRWVLAAGLGALAWTTIGSGWRGARGQEDAAPEAVALLERAAAAMAQLRSFRFRLTTERGATTIFEAVELVSVEGGVERPDRFQATINARLAFASLSLDVVGVGETVWIEDPLSAAGGYQEVSVETGLADLLNPDRLLLQAVGLIEQSTIAGEDTLDGVTATVVEGDFRPLRALELAGTPVATPTAEEQAEVGLVLDEPLFAQLWIEHGTDRVLQLALQGRLTTLEDPEIIRVLRLFDFDLPLDIQPPT
jgi:hypothetical protein